jgi:fumarate hydratase class II
MSCGARASLAELGKVKVSADKLWDAQTQRSIGNDIVRLRPSNLFVVRS